MGEVSTDVFGAEAVERVFAIQTSIRIVQGDVQRGKSQCDGQVWDWFGQFHGRCELFCEFLRNRLELRC